MMRRTEMKRTAFKPRAHVARAGRDELENDAPSFEDAQPAKPRPIFRGTYAPMADAVVAVPKTVAHRNQAVRDMANGRPCLLQVPGVCRQDPADPTVVACHSNWSDSGKGGARKADDHHSVWGCHACHSWLDQGGVATGESKRAAFLSALVRQTWAWAAISNDPNEPERLRKAAAWAINMTANQS
jgi:hypothetical protein